MAFALVHFYNEDTWDVIPYSDIIFEDENMRKVGKDTLEGFRTLVLWRDAKTRGNGKSHKFPAEIKKISDSKDYLLKIMKGEDTSPVKTGKGCRKRLNNAKYMYLNESEDESDDVEPVITKKLKASGPKKTEASRSASLASLIKERLTKQSQSDEDNPLCNDECRHKKETLELKKRVKMLEIENKRLNDQIEDGNDLKASLRKLRRYVSSLEDLASITPSSRSFSGRTSPLVAGRSSPVPITSSKSPSTLSTRSLPSSECSPVVSGRSTPVASGRYTPLESSPSTMPKTNTSPIPTAVYQSPTSGLPDGTTTHSPLDCLDQITDTNLSSDMVTLGPSLVLKKNVFKRIMAKKVGSYVANIMGATLSREHMATHSYKGQKGKNGQTKPRLDPVYTTSLIEHAKSVQYSNMPRQVIEEDVIKAIKFKLNNEEQAWKKQHEPSQE